MSGFNACYTLPPGDRLDAPIPPPLPPLPPLPAPAPLAAHLDIDGIRRQIAALDAALDELVAGADTALRLAAFFAVTETLAAHGRRLVERQSAGGRAGGNTGGRHE